MKVTYEFNLEDEDSDDESSLQIFQIARKMYLSLHQISDYMRMIRKGYCEDTIDEIEDKITDIILESNIGDVEWN